MSKASLDYIRRYYRVPAKVGGRVRYSGDGEPKEGTIRGTSGPHLRIKLDGERHIHVFHPTWKLEYLGEADRGDG
jgi:hypothetical protein